MIFVGITQGPFRQAENVIATSHQILHVAVVESGVTCNEFGNRVGSK